MGPRYLAAVRLPLFSASVAGDSMSPTYRHGDWVVVWRTGRIGPGHVVAVRDPRQRERLIVKRVAARRAGGWWLLGDDPDRSTDSRHFGPVPPDLVAGRVLFRFHRSR